MNLVNVSAGHDDLLRRVPEAPTKGERGTAGPAARNELSDQDPVFKNNWFRC